ncbi:glycosyltransferase [Gammaproteobacteria bacterium]|nr:glycosyltransferase [Gammaproteobacteria bacterium]
MNIIRILKKTYNLAKNKFIKIKLGNLNQHKAIPIKFKKQKIAKKNKKQPRISIVIPSYNQAEFLEKTIKSILSQKYSNLELIVQDGGSTDNSVEILKKYEKHLKHWESKKDGGQSQAINLGFKHSSGEIMAYLNSDDLLLPNSLNYISDYFLKNPSIDVTYGHRILINENNDEIGRWVLPPHDCNVLKFADYIPQETLFWRKSAWEKAGAKIDESFKFAMDWDLLIRLQNIDAKFHRLPKFIGAFRIHSQQKTSSQMDHIGQKEMNKIRFNIHGRTPTQIDIKKATRKYLYKHLIYDLPYKLKLIRY